MRLLSLAAILALPLSAHPQAAGSSTSGIQEAIDALGKKPGLIEIPAGRHVLKRSIVLHAGVTLRGSGAASVLVKCDGAASPLAQSAKSGDQRIVVKNAAGFEAGMELALARQTEGYGPEEMDAWGFDWVHPVITAVRGTTLELDRPLDEAFEAGKTTVLNFFPAIRVERVQDVAIERVQIEGNLSRQPKPYSEFQAAAVALLLAKNVRIHDCTVREWPSDGISVQGGSDVLVSGCTVERVRGHGYHPGSSVVEVRFLHNRASDNLFDGLYFCQAVTRSVVDGNLFVRNGRHGIGGLGGGKEVKTRDHLNVVSRNICEGNAQAGIEIGVSRGHRVTDNICRNNSASRPGGWPGILIRGASELLVSGNLCGDDAEPAARTQSHGILEEGGHANEITGNQVDGNRGAGLQRTPGK